MHNELARFRIEFGGVWVPPINDDCAIPVDVCYDPLVGCYRYVLNPEVLREYEQYLKTLVH